MYLKSGVCLAALFVACLPAQSADWGSITGQIVIDGDAPKLPPVVAKGNAAVKDPAVCAVMDVSDERLVVDPKTKGIANVCIYLKAKPSAVHPDLAATKDKEIVCDQKGCVFIPHTTFIQVGQTARCINNDGASHNVHTNPFAGQADNFILKPNDTVGVKVTPKVAEKTPVKVVCDIHPHMVSYWIVVDHPYAAITDAEGKFKIENLPAGEQTFVVWHDTGYIERTLKVSVKAGATTDIPVIKAKPKLK